MIQLISLDNLFLWFIVSILITIVWAICMGDPDASDTGNIILTVICGILALPITILIAIIGIGIFKGRNLYKLFKRKS